MEICVFDDQQQANDFGVASAEERIKGVDFWGVVF